MTTGNRQSGTGRVGSRESAVVILSHTYVEPENRGKLRELAKSGPVTVVVPSRWREGALGRSWEIEDGTDQGLKVVATRWLGPLAPSRGGMAVPRRAIEAGALLQIEEEPWTPTARIAMQRGVFAKRVLFTWENIDRPMPAPWSWWRTSVFSRLDGLITGNVAAGEIAIAQGYRGPMVVIPQLGVELPPVKSRAERAERAGRAAYVGRLVPEKGIDLLLRALPPSWSLDILGDGPERAALQRLAAELGIGERVRFLGARPHAEVAAVWPTVDVLVLPSRTTPSWREQLGHVLLEAMAHEVVVVGSSSGAIPEVIGDAGLIFPEGDHDALRAALLQLADAGARERLAAAGRQRVEQLYTNERLAARTRDFHAQVMG